MRKISLGLLLVLAIALLTACTSTGPFEVTGALLDATNGQVLNHGRLILCPMSEDGLSCTMSVGLTSSVHDYEDQLFHFDNVMTGKFAVLYAADDSLNPVWDFRVIRFNAGEFTVPQGFVLGSLWDSNFDESVTEQLVMTPPLELALRNSLEVKSLQTCAVSFAAEDNAEGGKVYRNLNGYVYAPDMQLALIMKDGAALTVDISGNTSFNVSIWDSTQECNNTAISEFNPLPPVQE